MKCSYCGNEYKLDIHTECTKHGFCSDQCVNEAVYERKYMEAMNTLKELYHCDPNFKAEVDDVINQNYEIH